MTDNDKIIFTTGPDGYSIESTIKTPKSEIISDFEQHYSRSAYYRVDADKIALLKVLLDGGLRAALGSEEFANPSQFMIDWARKSLEFIDDIVLEDFVKKDIYINHIRDELQKYKDRYGELEND